MAFLRVAVALLCLVLIESASSAVPKLNSVKRHPFADTDLGGRIINGTLAEAKATKHQISLRRRLNDGYFFGTGHICGAVLIRYNVALSAGHCIVDQWIYDGTFVDKESLILVMGNLDRFERNENTLIFDIKEMVLPLEKFNLATYDKDIALLFLDGSVPKDHPTVAPIALVESEMEPGTVCQVTGWGRTEDGYATDFLMTVDLPIISHEVCVTETDFDEELIGEGMICAGYLEGERDACAGDSGGPMVCNQKLGAIVSWGSGCALPRRPGVYTSIDFWRDWIEFEIAAYEATENGSGTEEPGTEEPGTEEPGTEEPGTEEPGTEEPITEEPGSGEGSGDGDGDAAFSIRSSVTLISGCFLLVTTLFNKLI